MCKLPIRGSSILTLLSSIGVYIPADPQFPKHSRYAHRGRSTRRRRKLRCARYLCCLKKSVATHVAFQLSHSAWLTTRLTVAEFFCDEDGQDAAAHGHFPPSAITYLGQLGGIGPSWPYRVCCRLPTSHLCPLDMGGM
jgi:hypothetical protein